MRIGGVKLIAIVMLLLLTMGFRTLPGGSSWGIIKEDPKLWLEFCVSPTLQSTGLPADDPLYGTFVDFATAVNSILTDFNAVIGSYLELALKSSDADYTDVLGERRRISVCFSDLAGGAGGHARSIWEDGKVIGCEILMEATVLDSTYAFILTLTHEIGHCIGLDHPQETTHSIMSYYIDLEHAPRLKLDDKIGVTHLYPIDPDAIKETPTFGLSCSI